MQSCHSLRCKLIDKSTTNVDLFKIGQFVTDSVEATINIDFPTFHFPK